MGGVAHLLEDEGEGRVVAAHSLHGRLEVQEAPLLQARRDLGREPARTLLHHTTPYPIVRPCSACQSMGGL